VVDLVLITHEGLGLISYSHTHTHTHTHTRQTSCGYKTHIGSQFGNALRLFPLSLPLAIPLMKLSLIHHLESFAF
jgi:hypothetical protein